MNADDSKAPESLLQTLCALRIDRAWLRKPSSPNGTLWGIPGINSAPCGNHSAPPGVNSALSKDGLVSLPNVCSAFAFLTSENVNHILHKAVDLCLYCRLHLTPQKAFPILNGAEQLTGAVNCRTERLPMRSLVLWGRWRVAWALFFHKDNACC